MHFRFPEVYERIVPPYLPFHRELVYLSGLFAGVKGEEEEKALKQLLLAFVILPVTEKTARLGGLYRGDYGRSHGTGLADALIAATSEVNGADLVAFNQ